MPMFGTDTVPTPMRKAATVELSFLPSDRWVCMPKVCKSLAERRPLICNVKGNKALLLEEVTRPWRESRKRQFLFISTAAINTKYLEHKNEESR